ncbi:MAG TPA: ribonuclease HII [Dehalococcoidia bacterium]|nr:ribonuclease HII [Dehalococcoidia bacterium]
MNTRQKPSFSEEKALHARGYHFIAGVDEVGRGALMGPVVAAAVILPENPKGRWRNRVRDSKQLSPTVRESLYEYITEKAVATAIGVITPEQIDSVGIARATRLAMKAAVEQLIPEPQYLLIDYFKIAEVTIPQKGITFGDSICFSIACASIIAKVYRDKIVSAMDEIYPGYEFSRHKGYGTREHLTHLQRQGPCPEHRRSFGPVKEALECRL